MNHEEYANFRGCVGKRSDIAVNRLSHMSQSPCTVDEMRMKPLTRGRRGLVHSGSVSESSRGLSVFSESDWRPDGLAKVEGGGRGREGREACSFTLEPTALASLPSRLGDAESVSAAATARQAQYLPAGLTEVEGQSVTATLSVTSTSAIGTASQRCRSATVLALELPSSMLVHGRCARGALL